MGFASKASLRLLASVAEVSPTETVAVEAGHAFVLRELKAKSMHSKSAEFLHTSATFTLHTQHAIQRKHWMDPHSVKEPARLGRRKRDSTVINKLGKHPRKRVRRSDGELVLRTHGGGAWRTFVSRETTGHKGWGGAVFSGLKEKYDALSPEERAVLIAAGAAYTDAHRVTPCGSVYKTESGATPQHILATMSALTDDTQDVNMPGAEDVVVGGQLVPFQQDAWKRQLSTATKD